MSLVIEQEDIYLVTDLFMSEIGDSFSLGEIGYIDGVYDFNIEVGSWYYYTSDRSDVFGYENSSVVNIVFKVGGFTDIETTLNCDSPKRELYSYRDRLVRLGYKVAMVGTVNVGGVLFKLSIIKNG